MNKQEAILISAYTGFMLVPTGQFGLVHEACEKALGRPIWTHEFANKLVQEEIQEILLPKVLELVNKAFEEAQP